MLLLCGRQHKQSGISSNYPVESRRRKQESDGYATFLKIRVQVSVCNTTLQFGFCFIYRHLDGLLKKPKLHMVPDYFSALEEEGRRKKHWLSCWNEENIAEGKESLHDPTVQRFSKKEEPKTSPQGKWSIVLQSCPISFLMSNMVKKPLENEWLWSSLPSKALKMPCPSGSLSLSKKRASKKVAPLKHKEGGVFGVIDTRRRYASVVSVHHQIKTKKKALPMLFRAYT
ncbi:hypothetical protein F2Q68_00001238 [Brassica cretica]|uniref:Uncharacterized protein n=2 Tax=Brassica cretica TaxID=69181 RepID=A0ABQ7C6V8_BRACR|nr:hypothetical protein F2Q68_00001238 [Brassica cretica]KAF3547930.1 hypothetical protein DY000_02001652 [Brassica cretica]